MKIKYLFFGFSFFFLQIFIVAGEKGNKGSSKTTVIDSTTKSVLMNGNNIIVDIFNDGSIAHGDGLIRNVNNFVWKGLGDFYTAGIIVGGEVKDTANNTIHIISSAINDRYAHDFHPQDSRISWEWHGLPGFDNPDNYLIATNDNPSSWPVNWSNWKGLFGDGNVLAEKEAYFVMDDRRNAEFNYYPFPDSSRKGLGIEVSNRIFQFSDANAADVLFAHYTIKNVSSNNLEKVVVGMYLDVDVGGGSIGGTGGFENIDDLAFFNKPLNLVYYWDNDGKGYLNLPTHYTGVVHLATPGNPKDGIDNDSDGLTDENQSNGIDDDGDWDISIHDIGADGKAGTNDTGENNGIPTAGEPNFETLDKEESDEIGLSSFRSWQWSAVMISDDEAAWNILHNGFNDTIPNMTDIASLFGSGDFSLPAGAMTTYSLAFFCSWSLDSTITLAQKIVDEYSIRFSPDGTGNRSIEVSITSPTINQSINNTASINWQSSGILQNRKIDIWYSNVVENEWNLLAKDAPDIGLYSWNTTLFRDGAFYKIRLVSKKYGNKGFAESQYFKINNANNASPEAYFVSAFKNTFKDTATISWVNGDAEGSSVTSTLYISTNDGVTYSLIDNFSTVHDYLLQTKQFPNSYNCYLKLENSDGTITSETISPKFSIVNVYKAIKDSSISQISGGGTGDIIPVVVDSVNLNSHEYQVTFDSVNSSLVYSVFDKTSSTSRITKEPLPSILAGGTYFDGIRMTIKNDPISIDTSKSGFINNNPSGINTFCSVPQIGVVRYAPLDVLVRFNSLDTTSNGKYFEPGDTLNSITLTRNIIAPFTVRFADSTIGIQAMVIEPTASKNNRWDWNEPIIILTPQPYQVSTNNTMLQITFKKYSAAPFTVKNGNTFIARMKKPFTVNDTFEFVASGNNLGPTNAGRSEILPKEFSLFQNFPNPFNPATTIRFAIPQSGITTLTIYDALGREIKTLVNEERIIGDYEVHWNGTDNNSFPVATGLYFYRLVAGNFMQTKKMILLK